MNIIKKNGFTYIMYSAEDLMILAVSDAIVNNRAVTWIK